MGYQEWRTPIWFFDQLDEEFNFTVDVAATKENTLCKRYYTKEQDGLAQDWSNEVVWCNPPYQVVGPWVCKAAEERQRGAICVLLLNPCTDTGWFHDLIWDEASQSCYPGVELRFYRGRLRFSDEHGHRGPSPRHPNMLAVFRPALES